MTADAARKKNFNATHESAEKLVRRLPLVHRTGGKSKGSWLKIFENDRLEASRVDTTYELALERERCAYLYLGACAFDKGHVVLVLDAEEIMAGHEATFTPFDTGSFNYCTPTDQFDDDNRRTFLCNHTGRASDVTRFATEYISAHFTEPRQYVRAPQESATDFPVYHKLESKTGDRRAWTVEVQCETDVGISSDPLLLRALFLRYTSDALNLPDDYLERAVALDHAKDDEDFVRLIAEGICTNG